MPTDTHEPVRCLPTVTAMAAALQDLTYARTQELPCAEALLRRVLRCYAAWARRQAQHKKEAP